MGLCGIKPKKKEMLFLSRAYRRRTRQYPDSAAFARLPVFEEQVDIILSGLEQFLVNADGVTDYVSDRLLPGGQLQPFELLQPETAGRVFDETLSPGSKPLQVYAADDVVRSIHGASYTRLFNVDLLTMVREFATDFILPQKAGDSGGEDR